MLIQKVSRTTAEKIFLICQNGEGTSISTGMGARFLGGAPGEIASTDGVQVIKTDSAGAMISFAGIADQDIASLGYGRIQAWGYVNSILLSQEANKTIAPVALGTGSILKWGNAAGMFTSTLAPETLSTYGYKYAMIYTTVNISGGLNYGSGFVRAL